MGSEQQTALDWVEGALRRAPDLAREASYLTVGFALLTFQRLQVRRRELERALERRCAPSATPSSGRG
jgi:hypothetical protein